MSSTASVAKPDTLTAEAHCRLGNQLALQGQWEQAEREFRKAIEVCPNLDQAYNNLGILLMRTGRTADAENMLLMAVRLNPANMAGAANLGHLYLLQQRFEPAEQWLRTALASKPPAGSPLWHQLQPRIVETSCHLATALDNLDRHAEAASVLAEAEQSCREVLALEKARAETWIALAMVMRGQGRDADAEACYREVCRLDPENLQVQVLLGRSLREQGKLEEAVDVLGQVVELNPGLAEADADLGLALAALGRFPEALAHYKKAITARPEEVAFRWNRTLAFLGSGDYRSGWGDYDVRFQLPGHPELFAGVDKPFWDGSPLNGRTLLLRAEQGLGDGLQYIRYAAEIPKTGGRIVVECRPVLTEILRTCPGVDEVIAQGMPRPAFDLFAPLMSLPRLLGTTLETVPNKVPYLFPSAHRVERWKQELKAIKGLRVGIVWQTSWKGRHRSCPLKSFAPLAKVPGVRLLSLQKGPATSQLAEWDMDIVDLGARTSPSFADTGALIRNLDLVVTVDTSIVHLAGALGVPTWLALASPAEWLWMHNREDTPWYPTVRLFRQPRPGTWDAVFARMAEELKCVVAEHKTP